MTDEKMSSTRGPGWASVSRFLVWLGGSTGAIGIVLSTFGFLVEHAYFDRLGIPRSLYQATPHEYLITGGKFLMGIIPLALAGLLQFCVNYWWLALAFAVVALLVRWRRFPSRIRWLVGALCLATSLTIVGRRFKADGEPDYAAVAMFTFIVVASMVQAYVEAFFFGNKTSDDHPLSYNACRAPFAVILISALVALPYLRGFYGLKRDNPVVQFVGKDLTYFCSLASSLPTQDSSACAQETWQIIDIGADRAIVRRVADSRIYVVPTSALTTFRILAKE